MCQLVQFVIIHKVHIESEQCYREAGVSHSVIHGIASIVSRLSCAVLSTNEMVSNKMLQHSKLSR